MIRVTAKNNTWILLNSITINVILFVFVIHNTYAQNTNSTTDNITSTELTKVLDQYKRGLRETDPKILQEVKEYRNQNRKKYQEMRSIYNNLPSNIKEYVKIEKSFRKKLPIKNRGKTIKETYRSALNELVPNNKDIRKTSDDSKRKNIDKVKEYQQTIAEYKDFIKQTPEITRKGVIEYRKKLLKLKREKRKLYKKLSKEAKLHIKKQNEIRKKLPKKFRSQILENHVNKTHTNNTPNLNQGDPSHDKSIPRVK